MDCELCCEAVSARLDDEVLPVAVHDLDGHLASCRDCAQFADEIAALNRSVRVRPAEPVPDLTASILAAPRPGSLLRPSDSVGGGPTDDGSGFGSPSARVLAAAGIPHGAARRSHPHRHTRRRVLVAISAAACVVLGALVWAGARPGEPADVQIAAGYVAVDPDGNAARVYLDVTNGGGADAITGAATTAADQVALHATRVEDGYVLMGDHGRIPVPAKGSVTFRPGGAHVMLEGLRGSVAVGDTIAVTVELADSTPVTVAARVVEPSHLEDLVGVESADG